MIYTMEQIEKLYGQLKKNTEIVGIKEVQNIKTITKPEKINSEIRVITY